jgi:hypothetical protein
MTLHALALTVLEALADLAALWRPSVEPSNEAERFGFPLGESVSG